MKYHIVLSIYTYTASDGLLGASVRYLCGRKEILQGNHRYEPKYHQGVCKRCEKIANG